MNQREKGIKMRKRRKVNGMKKGALVAGISTFILLNALNLLNNNQELEIKSSKVKAKKASIELDASEDKIYNKKDLYLFVENLGENPRYYFVDGSNRDLETPFIREEHANGIAIDLQKTIYYSITDPEHQITYHYNIYRDLNLKEEPILGRDGTIYLGPSGNIPASNIDENGLMTNFEWPLDYEEQEVFTKKDLEKIENYYNQSYEYLYKIKNDKFAIKNLGLVRYKNEYYIIDKASKTYLFINPETLEYSYTMPCVTDSTLGVLVKNGETALSMTSSIESVNNEFIKMGNDAVYCELSDWLSKEQLDKGYLSREEIATIEAQLQLKDIREYGSTRMRTNNV